MTYTKQSPFLVAELEELDDIAAGLGEADSALVLKNGEAGNGEVEGGLELGDPQPSSQQTIHFLPHSRVEGDNQISSRTQISPP